MAVATKALLAAIRGRKRQVKPKKRVPPQLFPDAHVRSYMAVLRPFLAALHAETTRAMRALLAERTDAWREDKPEEMARIKRALKAAEGKVFAEWPTKRVADQLRRAATDLSAYQKKQLAKQVKASIGINLPAVVDKGTAAKLDAFVREGVDLIKTIPRQEHERVATILDEKGLTGMRPEELTGLLQERFDVTESRARLIAKDQIGKLYSAVNESRQKALGVSSYIWRTDNDERVRGSHARLEGKVFEFADPPMGGGTDEDEAGNPGSGIQCRCYAEPNLEALLASLDV